MHKDELSLKFELSDLIEILDRMYDGFLLSSLDGRVFYANQAVERISGVSLDKIVGKTPNELENDGLILEQSIFVGTKEPITIVQKLKTGKEIFITSKPVYDKTGRIICFAANYRDLSSLESLVKKHKDVLKTPAAANDNWIGESQQTLQIKEKAAKVAKTEAIVLLLGESGVGKEVVANHIHQFSRRKDKPYIQINCGAIPEELMEAELFGYEKGAFTGAHASKQGLLEAANGGTVLLDEIGEMPLPLQVKLLRTLQTNTITRVGGTKKRKLNIRFIAATNKDLKKEVAKGTFREDLYYRLNKLPIRIPPLRERLSDLPALIDHLLRKLNLDYGHNIQSISKLVLSRFEGYYWPGNVRELENVLARSMIYMDLGATELTDVSLPQEFGQSGKREESDATAPKQLQAFLAEKEKEHLRRTLAEVDGVKTEAAKLLGISIRSLYYKLEKYNLA